MTIGIRIKLPGVTQEQYDSAHDHINPDRTSPGARVPRIRPDRRRLGHHRLLGVPGRLRRILGSDQGRGGSRGVEMQGPPDIKEFPVHETVQA